LTSAGRAITSLSLPGSPLRLPFTWLLTEANSMSAGMFIVITPDRVRPTVWTVCGLVQNAAPAPRHWASRPDRPAPRPDGVPIDPDEPAHGARGDELRPSLATPRSRDGKQALSLRPPTPLSRPLFRPWPLVAGSTISSSWLCPTDPDDLMDRVVVAW